MENLNNDNQKSNQLGQINNTEYKPKIDYDPKKGFIKPFYYRLPYWGRG